MNNTIDNKKQYERPEISSLVFEVEGAVLSSSIKLPGADWTTEEEI